MLGASLGAMLALAASFDPSSWQYRAPVRVTDSSRLNRIPFTRALYSRTRPDLGDLRIARNGEEIPYLLETAAGSVDQTECRPELINKTVVPKVGLQLTLDLSPCKGGQKHSRLRLTTAEKNFRYRVRIETSANTSAWGVARDDGHVFDFTQDGNTLSSLAVDYPVSTQRYLRATFLGWTKPDAISSVWPVYRVERPAEYDSSEIAFTRIEEGKTTVITLDLGESGVPHSRLRFEVDPSQFQRGVEIESSDDAKVWRSATRSAIFRLPGEESLTVSFPERRDRYLRARIFNRDDRPIPLRRIHVETMKRWLKFQPPATGDYWLYFGLTSTKTPVYDLVAILTRQAPSPEALARLGEWQANPGYRPPTAPFSDRHPSLLYGVLGVAIVIMGFVTFRFLAKVRGG